MSIFKMNYWILVLGASKGIGKAIALHLARTYPEFRVLAVARNFNSEEFSAYPNIVTLTADLSSENSLFHITSAIGEGRVKHIVYSATALGPFIEDSEAKDFSVLMTLNSKTPLFLCRDLAPKLDTDSKVLFLNSMQAYHYTLNSPFYSMSKAALVMTAKVLKKDLGLAVSTLIPGTVKTDMLGEVLERIPNWQVEATKVLEPHQVAKFVAHLLSSQVSQEDFSQEEWSLLDPSTYEDIIS